MDREWEQARKTAPPTIIFCSATVETKATKWVKTKGQGW